MICCVRTEEPSVAAKRSHRSNFTVAFSRHCGLAICRGTVKRPDSPSPLCQGVTTACGIGPGRAGEPPFRHQAMERGKSLNDLPPWCEGTAPRGLWAALRGDLDAHPQPI